MSKNRKNKIAALEQVLGVLIKRVAELECPNYTDKPCGTCVVCECQAAINDTKKGTH